MMYATVINTSCLFLVQYSECFLFLQEIQCRSVLGLLSNHFNITKRRLFPVTCIVNNLRNLKARFRNQVVIFILSWISDTSATSFCKAYHAVTINIKFLCFWWERLCWHAEKSAFWRLISLKVFKRETFIEAEQFALCNFGRKWHILIIVPPWRSGKLTYRLHLGKNDHNFSNCCNIDVVASVQQGRIIVTTLLQTWISLSATRSYHSYDLVADMDFAQCNKVVS